MRTVPTTTGRPRVALATDRRRRRRPRAGVILAAALGLAAGVPPAAAKAGAVDAERWLSSPDQALAAAREHGRYVLVDLYADWCGWCKVLEREVFASEGFRLFSKDFVLLRVDVEDRAEGSRLQALHGISSLPTMLILDGDGVRVGTVSGYFPADQYVVALEGQVARYEASLARFDQLRVGADRRALEAMADLLHRRRDGKRAAVLYERLLTFDLTAGERLLMLTRSSDAQRLAGRYRDARASADEARTLAGRLGQPLLAEQAELLSAQIAQEAGDCDVAERSLEGFLRAHPRSPMRGQARQLLSELRRTAACG